MKQANSFLDLNGNPMNPELVPKKKRAVYKSKEELVIKKHPVMNDFGGVYSGDNEEDEERLELSKAVQNVKEDLSSFIPGLCPDDEDEEAKMSLGANNDFMQEIEVVDVQDVTLQNALKQYHVLKEKWIIPPENNEMMNDWERCQRLWKNFKVDLKRMQSDEIEMQREALSLEIEAVLNVVQSSKDRLTEEDRTLVRCDLHKVLRLCQSTYDGLVAMLAQKAITLSTMEANNNYTSHSIKDSDQLSSKQEYIYDLYKRCAAYSFRKMNDHLYEPVLTSEGYSTHAYRAKMKIIDFVSRTCDRSLDSEKWKFITKGSSTHATMMDMAQTLEIIHDHELPNMIYDRHKFSFRNGVFLTRLESGGSLSTDPSCSSHEFKSRGGKYYSRFIPYNHPDMQNVSQRKVAAKYFDKEFIDYPDDMDWFDIPTPVVDYILRYQYKHRKDCEEIMRQMYRDIGRMLFNRGDLENWQYAIFVLGMAGTGKSTLNEHLMKKLYEDANVGEIDNMIEKQFGVGGMLYKKSIFMTTGGELNEHCQLDLAALLRMVSGEDVSAAVKNEKTPIKLKWPTHIALAGNGWPLGWKDTSNNVGRRFLIYEFMKHVKRKDMKSDLAEEINSELPVLLLKCVRAYLHSVNTWKNLTEFRPAYFDETVEKLKSTTNHLHAFMMDRSQIIDHSTLMVSESEMMAEFKTYCRQRNIPPSTSRGKGQAFCSIVQEMNDIRDIHVRYEMVNEQLYNGETHYGEHFFFGLGLTSQLTDADKHKFLVEDAESEEEEDSDEEEYEGSEEDGSEEGNSKGKEEDESSE